jgi:hypothetical protein
MLYTRRGNTSNCGGPDLSIGRMKFELFNHDLTKFTEADEGCVIPDYSEYPVVLSVSPLEKFFFLPSSYRKSAPFTQNKKAEYT